MNGLRVQANLELETPGDAPAAPGVIERFTFEGHDYVAHIAPARGTKLTVKPVERDVRARAIAVACHAFLQRHRARIDTIYFNAWELGGFNV